MNQTSCRCMSFVNSFRQRVWCAHSMGSWWRRRWVNPLLSEARQGSLLAILFHLQPRGGQVAPVAGDRRCGRRQLAGAGPRCGGTFRGFRKGRWTADNALGRHSVDFSDQKGDRISSDQIVTELCQFEGHPGRIIAAEIR